MVDVAAAENYVWGNARMVDRRYFEWLFAEGSVEPVVHALLAYRNSDGGFGHALEPDIRCPDSQPVTTTEALLLFDEIGAFGHPSISDAVAWCASIATPEGGLPWALPSLDPYPHAPWWDDPDPTRADLTPTARVVALLRKNGVEHPWLERAEGLCWEMIDRGEEGALEFHRLVPVGLFLTHARDRARAGDALARVGTHIREHLVESPAEVGPYAKSPTMWAPLPDAPWAHLFTEEEIEGDLELLADRQEPDGSWPTGFPPTTAGAELEWRARITINALNTLRSYGRL